MLLRTLGGLELKDSSFHRPKSLLLLAYLTLEGPKERHDLAALLWPDAGVKERLNRLRVMLSQLRRQVPGVIAADGVQVRATLASDAQEFLGLFEAGRYEEALKHYGGVFLKGSYVPSSSVELEEWAYRTRELLAARAREALLHLGEEEAAQGRFEEAAKRAEAAYLLAGAPEPAPEDFARCHALLVAGDHPLAADVRKEAKAFGLLLALAAEEARALLLHRRMPHLASSLRGTAFVGRELASAEADPPVSIERSKKTVDASAGAPPAFLHESSEPARVPGTPFVARERELAALHKFFETALLGQGRVVFVTGEAGSGKTALVRAFAAHAQRVRDDLIVAVASCNAYAGVGDPYLPFRDILGMLSGDVEALWQAGEITRDHALRLWRLLPYTARALLDYGPDLIDAFLLGKALRERLAAYDSGELEPLQRECVRSRKPGPDQTRLFEEYSAVLAALAARQPLCLVLDDLHWADTSSLSLLFYLGRRLKDSRVLIVGTYRPEDVAFDGKARPLEEVVGEFKRRFGAIVINLDEIERAERRHFVDALLDTRPNRLDEDFRQALLRHGRGHPLFTIELLHDMQDHDDLRRDAEGRWVPGPDLSWERLPARVEGVIERRLGRLSPELREALTIASVEGETFTAEVVAGVQAVDEGLFMRRLASELERHHRLVHAQEIRRLGKRRLSSYRFRHNLFQVYLYHTLDQITRAYLHEEVGRALEHLYEGHADALTMIAGQLARHFQEAGVTEKALAYRFQAGQQAVRISANAEAADHFYQALALLRTLPETLQRRERELSLQIALGVPVTALKGYGHPDVEAVYVRACELCRQVGNTPHLFPALYGLWRFYIIRGELQAAQELSDQLMQLAQNAQGQGLMVEAYRAVGVVAFHRGELAAARAACERGLARYNAHQHRPHAFIYGHDPAVTCLGYLAHTLWLSGYPDQALEKTQEVLSLARNLSHPFSLGHALVWDAAKLYQFGGLAQSVQDVSEEGIALAAKHGFPFWETQGQIMLGWALAEQGRLEEGLAQMQGGLAAWQATGARAGGPYFLALLSEAYGRAGEAERGLAVLADAVAAANGTGEQWWEAELYRLKGELLSMQGADPLEIEACFRQALVIARRQQARALALRAATSLGRLWQRQEKVAEAQELLSASYGGFTEGWDSKDLQEAERLLGELGTAEGPKPP